MKTWYPKGKNKDKDVSEIPLSASEVELMLILCEVEILKWNRIKDKLINIKK